jgi:hypothetical protein
LHRPRLGDREFGPPRHGRQRRCLAGLVLKRQHGLAHRRAVGRLPAADPGRQGEPRHRDAVQVDHLVAVEYGQVDGESGPQRQRVDVLEGHLAEAGSLQGDAAELEQLQSDPVAAAVPFQPAHRAHLVRQPVDGRLGQADPVTDLAQGQRLVTAIEGGEDGLEPAHDGARLNVVH